MPRQGREVRSRAEYWRWWEQDDIELEDNKAAS